MEHQNPVNINFSTIVMIAVSIGAFIFGIVSYFVYYNISNLLKNVILDNNYQSSYSSKNRNQKSDYDLNYSLNTYTNQSTSNNNSTNTSSKNNTTTNTNINTNNTNTKSSSKNNPLSIGEWGTSSKYYYGEYVDIPVRIINITRGSAAEEEYKNFIQKNSVYKYSSAKPDMERAIVEYEIDFTHLSKDVSAYLDSEIIGTGDTSSIKFNDKLYFTSTVNMEYDFDSGKTIKAKFATQLPINCSDYIIKFGSSSGSQAFFKGK